MELLDGALERVKQAILDDPDAEYYELSKDRLHDYTKVRGHDLPGDEAVARLRLDWEIAGAPLERVDTVDLMVVQIENDLRDLIENGDVEHRTDALLKAMNGEKKRGKKAVDIDVFSVHIYHEFRIHKDSTEYTIFLLMYVRFDD